MVPAPLLLVVFIVGVLLGRSSKFMRTMATLHADVHSRAEATATANNEGVQVVLVDADGMRRTASGRYILEDGEPGEFDWHGPVPGELLEASDGEAIPAPAERRGVRR